MDTASVDNPMAFEVVLDCRGPRRFKRDKSYHAGQFDPERMEYLNVNWGRMRGYTTVSKLEDAVLPVISRLRSPSTRGLINCVNGRHRSPQMAALLMLGAIPLQGTYDRRAVVDAVLNSVWRRRHLSEFTVLSGYSLT